MEQTATETEAPKEAVTPRTRDLVLGSTRTRALWSTFEWLNKTGNLPMVSRPANGGPTRLVNVAYSSGAEEQAPGTDQYRPLLHLGSYNYSGLNGRPEVVRAAEAALLQYGTTTSGVRLLNGTTELHVRLERRLAEFLGFEAVATYSSGFAANVGVLTAICSDKDIVLSDDLSHQSIFDGIKLSGAQLIKYPHRDMAALRGALKGLRRVQRKFIITDGVFSMDGDLAPLPDIVALAKEFHAFVVVDDAHATAAVGPCGRGTPAYFGLEKEIDILTGSLSKGLPGIGGFAAASAKTINLLRFGSNPYIFSASLPAPVTAGLIAAVDILEREPEIQARLHRSEQRLRDGVRALGLNVLTSESPIVPILMPNRETTYRFAKLLHEEGVFTNPVMFPAVPRRLPRIRMNASACLQPEDIERALTCIDRVAQMLNLRPRT